MINYTKEDVEKALIFAIQKHGKQKYGDKPYSYHLESVRDMAIKMGLSFELQVVAVLHDIIEDTNTLWHELCTVFGEGVEDCVFALTRADHESYDEYIRRLAGCSRETKSIKTCDLLCNLKETYLMDDKDYTKSKRLNKYEGALFTLATTNGRS